MVHWSRSSSSSSFFRSKRQRSKRNFASFCTIVLAGTLSGLTLFTLLSLTASDSETNLLRIRSEADQRDSEWRNVHVFYGKERQDEDTSIQWFSQVHQDEIVLDLLEDTIASPGGGGYFIDLAANDAKHFSNTFALERHGWRGLCIEPNPVYWYGLAAHRNCTVVGALVGEGTEKVSVKFRGVYGGIVGKMDEKLANRKAEPNAVKETRYTASVLDVLERFQVPKIIDYLSLDVEGAEYMIMEHFPFNEYRIRVMTVERPSKQLHELLEQNGYVFLKDLVWWGETLWAHTSTGLTPNHPKVQKIKTEQRNE